MTIETPPPFKGRHFQAEIIVLCLRWYLRYSLSYRDLEEMLEERGVRVDHSPMARWVLAYAPELEKRVKPPLKPTNDLWKVDKRIARSKGNGGISRGLLIAMDRRLRFSQRQTGCGSRPSLL